MERVIGLSVKEVDYLRDMLGQDLEGCEHALSGTEKGFDLVGAQADKTLAESILQKLG